jgi:hypothetical protein
MIWYHYWVSEVKWFRESRTPCWFVSTRDPFSKINPWAISGPIIHVWLKICRNSSILRIWVIIIKKSRNRNVKYKSLQNSVLIYSHRTWSRFLQKRSQQRHWSEAWMKDGIWRSYTLSSYPFGSLQRSAICVLKKLHMPQRFIADVSQNVRCTRTIL